jgi:hypothetical protein
MPNVENFVYSDLHDSRCYGSGGPYLRAGLASDLQEIFDEACALWYAHPKLAQLSQGENVTENSNLPPFAKWLETQSPRGDTLDEVLQQELVALFPRSELYNPEDEIYKAFRFVSLCQEFVKFENCLWQYA